MKKIVIAVLAVFSESGQGCCAQSVNPSTEKANAATYLSITVGIMNVGEQK